MNKWVFNIHTQLSSWEYDFFLIEKVSFSIRGASESNKLSLGRGEAIQDRWLMNRFRDFSKLMNVFLPGDIHILLRSHY